MKKKKWFIIFEHSAARRVCSVNVSSKNGYGGSIRQSGGKIGERGGVLEESYFLKKASKILIIIFS